MKNEEDVFIRKALASVKKAERYSRIKLVVVAFLALATAVWLTERNPSTERKLEPVLIRAGLIAAVGTAKIKMRIDRNTKAVLQAISEPHRGH